MSEEIPPPAILPHPQPSSPPSEPDGAPVADTVTVQVAVVPNARMHGNLHLTSSALSDTQNRVHDWLDDSGLLKTEKSVQVTLSLTK